MQWWLWSRKGRSCFPADHGEAKDISEALEAANEAAKDRVHTGSRFYIVVVTDEGRHVCEVPAKVQVPSTRPER